MPARGLRFLLGTVDRIVIEAGFLCFCFVSWITSSPPPSLAKVRGGDLVLRYPLTTRTVASSVAASYAVCRVPIDGVAN